MGGTLRRKSSRGSVMVELSLIFVLFASMLIGIVDFGQYLFKQQALVELVRSAARWGAVNDPTDSTSIKNMVLYAKSTAPSGGTAYFGLSASMVKCRRRMRGRTIIDWSSNFRAIHTTFSRRISAAHTRGRRSRLPSLWVFISKRHCQRV